VDGRVVSSDVVRSDLRSETIGKLKEHLLFDIKSTRQSSNAMWEILLKSQFGEDGGGDNKDYGGDILLLLLLLILLMKDAKVKIYLVESFR
jgi:hypothetical protein